MLFELNAQPPDIRAGVYKHYKGPLYQVIGYSHNASSELREPEIQVLYISLEIDPTKTGPRFATRDWREFFNTVCPVHDGVDAYSPWHASMIEDGNQCKTEDFVERFTYMGPVYYKGFENERP